MKLSRLLALICGSVLRQAEGGTMCALCVTGCIAVASPGVVTTGGAVTPAVIAACTAACVVPCATAGVATACFSDDVFMMKIMNSSACPPAVPTKFDGGACTEQVPVRDVRIGDTVLTKDLDGKDLVTSVVHNKRHISKTMHMNVSIETAKGIRNLVVTADHVMLTMNGYPPIPTLVKAEHLTAGEVVLVQGEGRGVVVSVVHELLDHKNELVTAAGTVLANGVQVTTICADELISTDAQDALPSWQSKHAVLGAIAL